MNKDFRLKVLEKWLNFWTFIFFVLFWGFYAKDQGKTIKFFFKI